MHLLTKFRQTSRIEMLKTVVRGRICCAIIFYEELIAVFKLKKKLELEPNLTKTNNFPVFKNFMQLLSKFRQTSRIEMLKTVVRVRICCAVRFHEESIAVFKLKKTRIGTEFYKKPIIFQFSKSLCNCCHNCDRIRGLEC